MQIAEPRGFRWNQDNYYQLADLGCFDGRHVELIAGEILEMPPQKDVHAYCVTMVDYALRKIFADGYVIRVQMPMNLGEFSLPEPDIAVVRGSPQSLKRHPKIAELVVEVAEHSLRYDRDTKAGLYASAAIPEYWIFDIVDKQLEVRRQPMADSTNRFGYSYADVSIRSAGQMIAPLAAPQSAIAIADLLP